MTIGTEAVKAEETIRLSPSEKLPWWLVLLAVPTVFWLKWLGLLLFGFGLFLWYQSATIRLEFTPEALVVLRSERVIREFPYQAWQNWRIFGSTVPILFYFRETKSIHFLPILFDPETLRTCLEARCERR